MEKRKGPSTSRPRARDKAAKEGSDAKRAFEHECAQLGRDISALEAKQGKLEEQLGPLRREEEQVQQSLLTKIKRLTEVENAQRLGKLPQKVWEKVLDELDENDLFPLALSCRFFRQKQKELVGGEWTRQSGDETSKPHLALRTRLIDKKGGNIPERGQPLSVEYLRFCYKDAISRDVREKRADCVRCLAAFYGHLPLLQEFLEPWGLYDPLERFDSAIAFARYAGESSFRSVFLFVLASDLFLAFSSSQHGEANWRPCSG